jgi:hypothetical protein
MVLHNFLNSKQVEIGDCLDGVLNKVSKIIVTKNNKIQSLIKQNEELNNKIQKQDKNRIIGNIIKQKNSFGKYLKEIKKNNNLLRFILTKQLSIRKEGENYVKSGQLEAFKVVVNEIENKKNKILEQEELIIELQREKSNLETKIQIINATVEEVKKENEVLLDKNTQIIIKSENQENEILILKQQSKELELLKTKYSNSEGVILQLNGVLEQKNTVILEQNNEIEKFKTELKNKNLKIMELKDFFVEILDDFNDILQRVNQDEWRY